MPVAVEAVSPFKFIFIFSEGQGFGHGLVGQGPIAMLVIQIVLAVLQEDADRFLRSLANHCLVVMPALAQRRPAGDVGEAADPGQHLAEFIRALPGDGEGADAATADAANGPAGGVVAQFVTLFDFGKDLFEQKSGVLIRERVIFKTAIRPAVSPRAWRDEYSDGHRHIAFSDQVVENDRDVVLRVLPVLKDHHARRAFRLVLRGDVDPPVARRAFKDFARPFWLLNQFAFGRPRPLPGFGRGGVDLQVSAPDLLVADLVLPFERRTPGEFSDARVNIRRADAVQWQLKFRVTRADTRRGFGVRRVRNFNRPGDGQFVDFRRGAFRQIRNVLAEILPHLGGELLGLGAARLRSQRRLQGFRRDLILLWRKNGQREQYSYGGHDPRCHTGFLSIFGVVLKRRKFIISNSKPKDLSPRGGRCISLKRVLSLRRKLVLPALSRGRIADRNNNKKHPGRSCMRRKFKCLICILFFAVASYGLAWLIPDASAQTRSAARSRLRRSIDFKRQIEPIFARSCYQCHGEKKVMGQLRLDSPELAMKGGVSGPSIIPGDGKQSLLLKRILGAGGEARMPMGGNPLKPAEIALIGKWIDQGANWSGGDQSAVRDTQSATSRHWAYIKPVRPAAGRVKNQSWV